MMDFLGTGITSGRLRKNVMATMWTAIDAKPIAR
jgi:hypothetical protein